MKEELSSNEDIIFTRQNDKVKQNRGNTVNTQRRYINAAGIIVALLIVLCMLSLWLLRLLGVVGLPQ